MFMKLRLRELRELKSLIRLSIVEGKGMMNKQLPRVDRRGVESDPYLSKISTGWWSKR